MTRNRWLRRNVVSGAALLVFFSIALVAAFTIQKGVPGRSYHYVNAAFSDVGSLRVGDDVRQHSVRIGQVSDISVGNGQAVVRLQLPGGTPVHQDAKAVIRARSALGQAYVDLDPGTSATPSLGSHVLPVEATTSQQQLDTLLNVFDDKTRKQARGASLAAGTGLGGHGQDLSTFLSTAPSSLTDLGTVSSQLASSDADLSATLQAAATLSARFRGRNQQLTDLLRSSAQVLDAFATDNGKPITETLRQAPATLRDARSALDNLAQPLQDTTTAVSALRPGLASLGTQAPDLQSTLTSGTTALSKVPATARLAAPAVDSLTVTSHDLRPLASPLATLFERSQQPLAVLAPYGTNSGLWFEWFANALSQKLPDGSHYLRLDIVTGTSAVGGSAPVKTPYTARDPYPQPSEAYNEGGAH